MDSETGLYYYEARYLDPKYGLWISTDPALGDYVPKAPINEDAKKYNQNLPGMGGIFNPINGNLYAYAGNNPIKFVDPDGKKIRKLDEQQKAQVDLAIINVTKKLDYIINELVNSYKNNAELDPNILSAGRKYLKSSFGEEKSDYLTIALKLQKIKAGICRLNSTNLFYQDSDEAYGSYIGKAFPPMLCNFIELTQSFFEEKSYGGWTNQEGTLIHEVSHNLFVLHTNLKDEEIYSAYTARNYMPDEGQGAKQNNASNWEFFYYDVFDPKNN